MSRADPVRMIDLLRRLIATDSINPSLVPGARGEQDLGVLLLDECCEAGLDAAVDQVMPGRVNVVARLHGGAPGRRLLLNGHMDTVGVEGMRAPFVAEIRGDRLYGRGAYDMKASLAAMIEAARIVVGRGLPAGELVLAFVADEEHASIGTADLVDRHGPGLADAAIVTEPTALDVCVAHKGFVWARIGTSGRAAHGSLHAEGDDAIVRMGHVLAALDRLDRETLPRRTHPLLGRASVHASTIEGGLGLSTYPDRCEVVIERRTLPGESDEAIRAELEDLLVEARALSPGLTGRVEIMFSRPPLEVRPDAPIIRTLAEAVRAVRGQPPRLTGASPWFDAALLAAAGIPTVLFGPAGAGAHAAEEWVEIPSVVTCAEVLADVARRFCAGTG
jgi:acetylornithine deacetylase